MDNITNETAELANIRRTIAARTDGLRRKDAELVIAQGGPGYVHFSLAPPLVSDSSGAAGLNGWFQTWRGPLGYEFRELALTADGDLAYGFGLAHLCGTKVDGEEIAMWFRLTLCFKKIAGTWKIVHEHQSVPFYMDGSYRASIDLAP